MICAKESAGLATSEFTKQVIAQGMKTLLETTRFEDISVGELAKKCNVSRNTFYYHFKDKYDVIAWIFYSEITPIIGEASVDNWSERLLSLCRYMQQNKTFYIKVLHVRGQNCFAEYLMKFYVNLVQDHFLKTKGNQVLEPEQINIISQFYAVGLTGVIISWAENGMETAPEPIVATLKELLSGEIFDKILALKENKISKDPFLQEKTE